MPEEFEDFDAIGSHTTITSKWLATEIYIYYIHAYRAAIPGDNQFVNGITAIESDVRTLVMSVTIWRQSHLCFPKAVPHSDVPFSNTSHSIDFLANIR